MTLLKMVYCYKNLLVALKTSYSVTVAQFSYIRGKRKYFRYVIKIKYYV